MKNNIKAIRDARDLTIQQLADAVDATPRMIQYLENGERNLTQAWLERLAKALKCEITDLITPTGGGWKGHKDTSAPRGLLIALVKSISAGETENVVDRAIKVLDMFYAEMPADKKDSPDALTDAAKMALLSAKHSFKDVG